MPASSHPPGQHCSAPLENSGVQRSSLAGKGRMRWATNFPSLSHHSMEDHFSSTLLRDWKSQDIGTGWNNREQLGFPISATQQGQLWFTVTSSVEDPNRFHHWRNQHLGWLSWTPCRFHHCTSPHRFPHSQMPPNSPSLAVTRPCNLHWKPA